MSALAPQRRAHIIEEVQLTGGVRLSELTRLFGVSDMTIRRDLDSLAKRGLIAKVHAGRRAPTPAPRSPRSPRCRCASQRPDQTVILAGGVRTSSDALVVSHITLEWTIFSQYD